MSLIGYIFKRILVMIPLVFGVLTITFFLSRLMAGDPIIQLIYQAQVKPAKDNFAVYWQIYYQLGLDQPLHIQYFRYIADIFTGNWGVSVYYARDSKVWDLIKLRLPKTIDLALFSMVITTLLGIKIGIITAKNKNKIRDIIFRSFGIIGVAFPVFLLGMLLQYYLCDQLNLFPRSYYKSFEYADPPLVSGFYMIDAILAGQLYKIPDYLYHLILPVFCLTFVSLASIIRHTRSSMLEILQQDYIRTARAKGCKEKIVLNKHALKNSLYPTVTVIGFNFASLLSGTVILESTFGLPGLGSMIVDATLKQDYWVINVCMVVIAFIYIFTVLIIDILYAVLDPRIRY